MLPRNFHRGAVNRIAPGVYYIPAAMANVYAVGHPGEPWVLIDAGVPGTAGHIRRSVAGIYGRHSRPEAILLTHGHFDHVGALKQLAAEWDVPIYAHRMEAPYLTGRSPYPPPDPTVGGFMAQLSRTFPRGPIDVSNRLRLFSDIDDAAPHASGWRVIETPGHTPGHVSFFREEDRVLIAGDAFTTINQESPGRLITQKQEFRWPPIYLTQDWDQATASIHRLSGLRPTTIVAGHGLPMTGPTIPSEFEEFATNFRRPFKGRYVDQPAVADERGVIALPPRRPDPLPEIVAGTAALALTGAAAYLLARRLNRA